MLTVDQAIPDTGKKTASVAFVTASTLEVNENRHVGTYLALVNQLRSSFVRVEHDACRIAGLTTYSAVFRRN